MRIIDAIYRELRFGLASDLGVAEDHIKLERRNTISKAESDYPWVIFLRSESSEDNQIRYARERIDIALIGLQSSPTKGDALLEEMRVTLVNHFAGKHKRWGQYEEDGTPDPDGGLRMFCQYLNTVEAFDGDLEEKMQILSFVFTYIR